MIIQLASPKKLPRYPPINISNAEISACPKAPIVYTSYNKVTVKGVAASRVFFHLKAEAVRMGE